MGVLTDRIHRELTAEEIKKVSDTYHAWRSDRDAGQYADVPGFSKAARLADIRKHSHVLTPGRYVGAQEAEDDDEPFDQKMRRLTKKLKEQFAASATLSAEIEQNLRGLGYDG